jgi:hypothetical protein
MFHDYKRIQKTHTEFHHARRHSHRQQRGLLRYGHRLLRQRVIVFCCQASAGTTTRLISSLTSAETSARPSVPVGYQNPGKIAADGDHPYAGSFSVLGQFGAGATADYYEFEYSDNGGASWNSLSAGTVAAPTRLYFGPPLFGEPAFPPIRPTPPTVTTIGARTFIESRAHFEASHGAPAPGASPISGPPTGWRWSTGSRPPPPLQTAPIACA